MTEHDYDYPLVPTPAQLAQITLSEVEQQALYWLHRRAEKGVCADRGRDCATWVPEGLDEALESLHRKGAVMFPDGPGLPQAQPGSASFCWGPEDEYWYTYQIAWERAPEDPMAAGAGSR